MPLRDLATCPATTCSTTTTVHDAARIMAGDNIGFLVVVDGSDKPVGVLTDRDIVIRSVAQGRDMNGPVADVMTHQPAWVRDAGTVADAARVMADRLCRRVAVIDDAGKIIGVLSLDDLLRVAGDELGEVARAVRGTRHSHLIIP